MLQMQQHPVLSLSPSFNSYSSFKFSEIAANINEDSTSKDQNPTIDESAAHLDQISLDPNDDDEFEFAFACRDSNGSPISADEIFSNGQIRPIFPIFDRNLLNDSKPEKPNRLPLRKLLIEDRDPLSSSSSESDELERIPAGTYCVWKPMSGRTGPAASLDRCKKSNSTGSLKRWRFRNFLYRSNSEGKDTFVFLATEKKGAKTEISKDGKGKKGKGKCSEEEEGGVSTHEMQYVRNKANKEGDRRRSFLPYRQDLMGFFSNVNGLSRNLHPF